MTLQTSSSLSQDFDLERMAYPATYDCKIVKCACDAYNCMNDWYYQQTNQDVRNLIRVSVSYGLSLLGAGIAADPAIREACHATSGEMAWGGGSIGACGNGCSTYLAWEDDTRLKIERLERIERARQSVLLNPPLQIHKIGGKDVGLACESSDASLVKAKQEELKIEINRLQSQLLAQSVEIQALKEAVMQLASKNLDKPS